MQLKPDDLATAMLTALPQAWEEVKGKNVPFPSGGGKDQEVLFIAIARGLLTYLKNNQDSILNTISLATSSGGPGFTYNVAALDLNTDLTIPPSES